MMNDETYDIANEIFADMEDHPKKYMRVQIRGNKGIVALTGCCDGMVLKKALIAEFQNGQLSQLYEFDSEKDNENNLLFVAKKNKVVAYALGHGEISYSGHLLCYREKNIDADASVPYPCLDKVICGIFVTEYHAYLLVADTKHSKMLYEDLLLEEDHPNLLDVFRIFGSYKNNKTSEVNDHVEEE